MRSNGNELEFTIETGDFRTQLLPHAARAGTSGATAVLSSFAALVPRPTPNVLVVLKRSAMSVGFWTCWGECVKSPGCMTVPVFWYYFAGRPFDSVWIISDQASGARDCDVEMRQCTTPRHKNIFVAWHSIELIAIQLIERPSAYVPVLSWWFDCKPSRLLLSPSSSVFAYYSNIVFLGICHIFTL